MSISGTSLNSVNALLALNRWADNIWGSTDLCSLGRIAMLVRMPSQSLLLISHSDIILARSCKQVTINIIMLEGQKMLLMTTLTKLTIMQLYMRDNRNFILGIHVKHSPCVQTRSHSPGTVWRSLISFTTDRPHYPWMPPLSGDNKRLKWFWLCIRPCTHLMKTAAISIIMSPRSLFLSPDPTSLVGPPGEVPVLPGKVSGKRDLV